MRHARGWHASAIRPRSFLPPPGLPPSAGSGGAPGDKGARARERASRKEKGAAIGDTWRDEQGEGETARRVLTAVIWPLTIAPRIANRAKKRGRLFFKEYFIEG